MGGALTPRPLFDAYVMVDWSAASAPRRGADSIWYTVLARRNGALRRLVLENPATRASAEVALIRRLEALQRRGDRVLVGFDFPFGYPSGTAARLGMTGLPWRHFWQELDDRIEDDADNRNNRFDVAEALNRRLSDEAFPFWGDVREDQRPFLRRRGRRAHGDGDLAERRLCELRIRSTQPVWKLAGAGSVGSQSLMGIPRVWRIRRDPRLAAACHIWPFETGLRYDPRPQLQLAEVYPSLVPAPALKGKPKDAAQVVAIARHFAALDTAGRLKRLFAGDPALTPRERHRVEQEEAWILGVP
jgi:precorrin-8X/cobalt-precorrin-8 methylmutase